MKSNRLVKSLMRVIVAVLISLMVVIYMVVRPTFFTSQKQQVEISVNALELEKHVKHISENLSPRSYQNSDNLSDTVNYIQGQMKLHTTDVEIQNYVVNQVEYKNVIARFGPITDDLIVVGAHYDVMGEYPGADDNASGVAGLFELARLLSQSDLNKSIELVAYTLEEPPFFASTDMGSYIHAESVKSRNVLLMISLEMIGYFTDKKASQDYPLSVMKLFYPSKGNYISVVDQVFSNAASQLKQSLNNYTDLPAYSINAPTAVQGIDFSDHRNYWQFGFPAVMVTDTSFYRNKYYHTAEDTFEKLDYEAMAKVVFGVYKHVVSL
ncbi:M28 family peptidase [Marinicella sp. S1101]|uniref:M28 family peptidase n=1 Tax=Marinicella marina TaxID=2996016 RepID=UPI002260B598|nr:M28 family peptidase [Marinicella marina]MCX7554016.1 M28 family peptidase [Marinicella marina]MDJ1140508.1 M28 family peptidase [Marinicella marina]